MIRVPLTYEVVHRCVGPDGARIEKVQVHADPNPMPRLRLFRWSRRHAR